MSAERELLERVMYRIPSAVISEHDLDLVDDIKELLAQPEEEQELVTDKPTETAMAVMPNGVCVSNVYDAYEAGRKPVMSEQQAEAWIIVNKETGYRTQVSDLTPFLYHREIFEVIPLYTAPPKREPLGLEIMDVCGSEDYREGFKDGALYAEKCHGIGGEE